MKKLFLSIFIVFNIVFIGNIGFAATQADVNNQSTQVENLKRQISELDKQINDLETQANNLNNEIVANTESLLQAQQEEANMRKESEQRIRAIYMYGTEGYWEYLYNTAESPSDFISYYDIGKDIISADKENLNELKKKRQEIESLQQKLTNDRNSLIETKKQAEASRAQKQASLTSNQSTLQALQNQLRDEDNATATSGSPVVVVDENTNNAVVRQSSVPSVITNSSEVDLDALALSNTDETEIINELIENSESDKEIETEDGASAAMTVPRWMQSETTQTPESSSLVALPDGAGSATVVSVATMPGQWIWPLDANGNGSFYITSLMGTRQSPGGIGSTNHAGTDIGASYGTAILAAASGEVTLAGTNGGYGNCVKISHGNGYTTLYGHMSSIAVSSGEHVEAGQIIGFVGSTGWSTGPHLHFEVKCDGSLVNGLSLYGQEIYDRLSYSPNL